MWGATGGCSVRDRPGQRVRGPPPTRAGPPGPAPAPRSDCADPPGPCTGPGCAVGPLCGVRSGAQGRPPAGAGPPPPPVGPSLLSIGPPEKILGSGPLPRSWLVRVRSSRWLRVFLSSGVPSCDLGSCSAGRGAVRWGSGSWLRGDTVVAAPRLWLGVSPGWALSLWWSWELVCALCGRHPGSPSGLSGGRGNPAPGRHRLLACARFAVG